MGLNLGGFVPRKFYQFSKDPVWCIVAFGVGFWPAEYAWLNMKLRCSSMIHDPRRYAYNERYEHH